MKKHFLLLKSLPDSFTAAFTAFYILNVIYGMFIYKDGYNYFLSLTHRVHFIPLVNWSFWLAIVALSLSLVSHFKKNFLFIGIAFFALREIIVSLGLKPYSTNISFIVLLLILIDRNPIKKIHIALCSVYVTSSMAKLLWSSPRWLNGETLRLYLIESQLVQSSSAVHWCLDHPQLMATISVLTVMWELAFPLSLLYKYWTYFYFFTGILFHFGIWFLIGPNFFHFLVPTYAVMIPKMLQFSDTTTIDISTNTYD